MEHLVLPALNFFGLVGLLAYYLRAPLKSFVRNRHALLDTEIRDVSEKLASARAKFEEFSAKLKTIDSEIQSIRTQSRQDAEAMHTRVASDAKRLAERVVVDAKFSADGVFKDLKDSLRAEMGAKVVERAESMLRARLTGDDRVRLRREFSQQVEAIQ